jgi:anti-sigma regulatory factor (Ser/Thr protein kinase)
MERSAPALHDLRLHFDPSATSVASARRCVTRWAEAVGVGPDLDIVALLVSELATNAVVHAGSRYAVVASWQPPTLRVDVLDNNSTRPRVRQPQLDGLPGGRGLQLVQQLANVWGVTSASDHKSVWFALDFAGRRA